MKRNIELWFVVVFVVVNLAAPLVIGEKFPFTVSPMFCDQPSCYVTYEVLGPDGERLDESEFGLHLVYDGNPPGYGMGIEPKSTLHGFGQQASEAELKAHVQTTLARPAFQNYPFVIVRRHYVCCKDHCLERVDAEIKVENMGSDNE
ncbi:MAG: hypothetical protein AAFN77_09025 [Planctomycetota bacterium]